MELETECHTTGIVSRQGNRHVCPLLTAIELRKNIYGYGIILSYYSHKSKTICIFFNNKRTLLSLFSKGDRQKCTYSGDNSHFYQLLKLNVKQSRPKGT